MSADSIETLLGAVEYIDQLAAHRLDTDAWAKVQFLVHASEFFPAQVESSRFLMLNKLVKPIGRGELTITDTAQKAAILHALPMLIRLDRSNALYHMQIVRGKSPHGFVWCDNLDDAKRIGWTDGQGTRHVMKDYSISSQYLNCARALGATDEYVERELRPLLATQYPEWAKGQL